jgi:hypothetical protein
MSVKMTVDQRLNDSEGPELCPQRCDMAGISFEADDPASELIRRRMIGD